MTQATESYPKFLIEILNDRYFEGKLPEVEVVWNHQFSRTGGRIRYEDGRYLIELSWQQDRQNGPEEIRRIILHELCHISAMLVPGELARHDNPFFLAELDRVGAYLYCHILPGSELVRSRIRRLYQCPECGRCWERKRAYGRRMECPKCAVPVKQVRSWRAGGGT